MIMLEEIKRRLLHFDTDGVSIISDFVSARQRRAGILRRAVHICFYIQCAAALFCIIAGFAAGGAAVGAVVCVGALACVTAALMAVPGDIFVATVSYILNLVYAVICFIAGGTALNICGIIMLVSSLAALCGFVCGYFRAYILEYSPSKVTPQLYTLTGEPPVTIRTEQPPQEEPAPPRSDLLIIAEKVAHIMNTPRENTGKEEHSDA